MAEMFLAGLSALVDGISKGMSQRRERQLEEKKMALLEQESIIKGASALRDAEKDARDAKFKEADESRKVAQEERDKELHPLKKANLAADTARKPGERLDKEIFALESTMNTQFNVIAKAREQVDDLTRKVNRLAKKGESPDLLAAKNELSSAQSELDTAQDRWSTTYTELKSLQEQKSGGKPKQQPAKAIEAVADSGPEAVQLSERQVSILSQIGTAENEFNLRELATKAEKFFPTPAERQMLKKVLVENIRARKKAAELERTQAILNEPQQEEFPSAER